MGNPCVDCKIVKCDNCPLRYAYVIRLVNGQEVW